MLRHVRDTRISISLTIALLLPSCSDSAGPGTDGPLLFQARVDGQAWTPDNGANTTAHLTSAGHFQVVAIRRDTLFQARDGIGVVVRHLGGPGRYPLTSDLGGDCGLYAVYNPIQLSDTTFVSTAPNIGELEVTEIDTVNHRIAGRFEFEAQRISGTRRVRVTSGVFRVEYQTAWP